MSSRVNSCKYCGFVVVRVAFLRLESAGCFSLLPSKLIWLRRWAWNSANLLFVILEKLAEMLLGANLLRRVGGYQMGQIPDRVGG